MPLCSAPIPSPRDSTWQTAFGRFAMSTPVPLRSDFDAAQLHKLAGGSRDPDQTRRLLALAEVYAGGSRSGAARIGGVCLQCAIGFFASKPRVPTVSLTAKRRA